MVLLASISAFLSMITLAPLLSLMFFIIFLASMGKSLGVRRMYVQLLVKIFEVGLRLPDFLSIFGYLTPECACVSGKVSVSQSFVWDEKSIFSYNLKWFPMAT